MSPKIPIRMCVVCKKRAEQKSLNRYRVIGGNLELDKGAGRSFYLCDECLNKDEKILKKIVDKYAKGLNLQGTNLKEMLIYGKR